MKDEKGAAEREKKARQIQMLTLCDRLKACQSDPRSQGMPLSFYLLKPVKRITEYPILLEKLARNTPEGHPDLFNVQRALDLSKYSKLG